MTLSRSKQIHYFLKFIADGEEYHEAVMPLITRPFVGVALLFQVHSLRSSNSYKDVNFTSVFHIY